MYCSECVMDPEFARWIEERNKKVSQERQMERSEWTKEL